MNSDPESPLHLTGGQIQTVLVLITDPLAVEQFSQVSVWLQDAGKDQ